MGCLLHFLGRELEFFLAEIHVAFCFHGDEVDVGVVDFQTENSHTYFETGEGCFDSASYALGEDHHAAEFFIGEVEEIVLFALGDDEGMAL